MSQSSTSGTKDTGKNNSTVLKQAMSRYKRKAGEEPLSSWDEWIDPNRPEFFDCLRRVSVPKVLDEANNSIHYYRGPLFTLDARPGFYIAPQALSSDLQTALAYASLTEYCLPPHKTNIDAVPIKPHEQENVPHETFWYLWKEKYHQQHHLPPKYRSFKKLSWSVMGYHYDWTQRKYHPDAYSSVPASLQRIGSLFARTALLLEQDNSDRHFLSPVPPSYRASASIVNYYHNKSVMGAHQDDLEYDMTKPIVSLCLGHRPCVFVLGGDSQNDPNIFPLVLRPGDVVIMSGPCRLAYHAMARLLPVQLPASPTVRVAKEEQVSRTADESLPPAHDVTALHDFLQEHRININLRQVYPDGRDPREALEQN